MKHNINTFIKNNCYSIYIILLLIIIVLLIFLFIHKKENFEDNTDEGYFSIDTINEILPTKIISLEDVDNKINDNNIIFNNNNKIIPIGTIIPYYPNITTDNKNKLTKTEIEKIIDTGFFPCDGGESIFSNEDLINNNSSETKNLIFNGSIYGSIKLSKIINNNKVTKRIVELYEYTNNNNVIICTIPDLRKQFIVGVGSNKIYDTNNFENDTHELGDNKGAEKHKLSESEMPAHNHFADYIYHGHEVTGNSIWGIDTLMGRIHERGDHGINFSKNKGGNTPHENRPPFVAMYYLMYFGNKSNEFKNTLKNLLL